MALTQDELIRKLAMKLDIATVELDRYDRYFEGKVPLAFLAPEIAEATKDRLKPLTVPWPRVVVQAIKERLNVTGFRIGEADEPALWSIWQRNNLDECSGYAHQDALIHGRSFVLVWVDDQGRARITVESAHQCWVQFVPGSPVRQYGIRRWKDEDDKGRLDLYLPDKIVRFRSAGNVVDDALLAESNFERFDTIANPLGVVPLIPLVNRPRNMTPHGTSELADLLPLFDALSKLLTDMMIGSEFTALPRRWATGFPLPEKLDDQGKPTGEVDMSKAFDPLAGRTWASEDPNTSFGQLPGSGLDGFTNGLRALTEALAAAACLPPHYLGISTANPASADAIRSSEAALVAKVRERQRSYEGAWEEAMRLAVMVDTGKPDPRLDALEVTWADPETRTIAQQADAALKLVAAGILPPDAALEMIGYTATQIERFRTMRPAESA